MRLLAPMLVFILLAAPFGSAQAAAIEPVEFDTPEQRERYRALLHELRCTVCQNESLAESNAELARDLRREVERMVRSGSSRAEVMDFMVSRYGEFVLYRPPFNAVTWLLWSAPGLLLIVGGVAWWRTTRRASRSDDEPAFTAEDHRRAGRLLRGGDES
jgi:cytochrome c-type biogenesis protein CcmH